MCVGRCASMVLSYEYTTVSSDCVTLPIYLLGSTKNNLYQHDLYIIFRVIRSMYETRVIYYLWHRQREEVVISEVLRQCRLITCERSLLFFLPCVNIWLPSYCTAIITITLYITLPCHYFILHYYM